jgi:PLP dependent protein
MSIIENYHNIKKNLPNNIKLLVVTKNQTIDDITKLLEIGHVDFAESKIQEAENKWNILKQDFPNIKLHMIGHLQSNKIKKCLEIFDVIESIDNIKLLEKISLHNHANKKFFIQVNIGNEPQKSGIKIDQLSEIIKFSTEKEINISGLMCIPPKDKSSIIYFQQMLDLKLKYNLKNLSMGMSNDFEQAITYGSTQVRIGSAIFNNL